MRFLKYLIFSLLIIFTASNVFSLELTVDQAKKYLKDSPDYIKMLANFEKAKISYTETYYDYVNSISDLNRTNENAAADSDAPYKAYLQFKAAMEKKDSAQDAVDQAERNLGDFEYKLDYLLEKEYIALLQLERNYESALIKYEQASSSEQLAGLRYARGLINSTDYGKSKTELLNAKQSLLDAGERLEQGKKDFCYFLGININSELVLSNYEPKDFIIPDKDTLLSRASSNYYTFTTVSSDLDKLRDNYDSEYDYYSRETIRWNIIVKEMDYSKTKLDFENSISSLYNDYEKGLLAWEISENDYKSKSKDFKIAELKYERGLISENSFRLAQESFKNSENEWLQNKYSKYFIEYKIKLAEKGILV